MIVQSDIPTISDIEEAEMVAAAIAWSQRMGFMIQIPGTEGKGATSVHAPFTLFPSKVSEQDLRAVELVQPVINSLVDKLARNHAFLSDVCSDLSADDFSQNLFEIYKQCHDAPISQQIWFGIHRSDYMLHRSTPSDDFSLKQVEMNTISAGLVSLSSICCRLHSYLADRFGLYANISSTLPTHSIFEIPKAISEVWKLYGSPEAVVLMVVQPVEFNMYDQGWIEHALFENYRIILLRKTLLQISLEATLNGAENRLFIKDTEVAVVYFRSGYGPKDYSSPKVLSS